MSEKAKRQRPFLTAAWRSLAMLNYEIDPSVLKSLVPVGTELDLFDGKAFVSMVGFLFQDTRVLGIPIPFHRNFEEVNLRFYVRYNAADDIRRGVVFVKEIVPRIAITVVANNLYGEKYVALPMSHSLGEGSPPSHVEYRWKTVGKWNHLSVRPDGVAQLPEKNSLEEFITEHYWGYTARGSERTDQYEVRHPQWRLWKSAQSEFECNVRLLYGPQFVDALASKPASAFLAEGSAIEVYPGASVRGR